MPFDRVIQARDEANLACAADHQRLLPGEPAELSDWGDVQRWIGVYEDLVSFNCEVIERVERRLESLPAADRGPEEPDLLLFQAHLGRLRGRLAYWRSRSNELANEVGAPLLANLVTIPSAGVS